MSITYLFTKSNRYIERKKYGSLCVILTFYIALYERPLVSSCPVHHHLVNYSSDTLPLKVSSNIDKIESSSPQINGTPFSPLHYHHHGTCQRQYKPKGIITPLVNKGLLVDQQHLNENFKHSAPPSTGSSHSSSGIGSSMESPYNHWKYLVPLSVTTNDTNNVSSTIIEPIPLTSS